MSTNRIAKISVIILVFFMAIFLLSSGRAATNLPELGEPPTLESLINGKTEHVRSIRSFNAIHEAGIAYGSCAGMVRRQYELSQLMLSYAHDMDAIFDFGALAIRDDTPGMPTCSDNYCKVETDGYIIPPVLIEIRDVYEQKSDDLIRVFDAVYKIHKQAHFSYAPPNWRQYLLPDIMMFADCKRPIIKPETNNDRQLWVDGVRLGWSKGYEQANKIFEENLGRLKRDFEGMVRYHKLLRLGMVSKPIASGAKLGVTGDGKTTMNINEVVYRITAMPEFNMEKNQWK